jgi:hypothetical protein
MKGASECREVSKDGLRHRRLGIQSKHAAENLLDVLRGVGSHSRCGFAAVVGIGGYGADHGFVVVDCV